MIKHDKQYQSGNAEFNERKPQHDTATRISDRKPMQEDPKQTQYRAQGK
jgi:hypothetical protein